MSSLISRFHFEQLKKYNGPGLFLGGGFAAGFLIFLFWLAVHPSSDKQTLAAQPAAGAGTAIDPLSADAGVLNGITGAANVGQRAAITTTPEDSLAPDDQTAVEDGADATADDNGDAAPAAPDEVSDEQAIANGLLDAPGAAPVVAAPAMQTYYVEIANPSGEVEELEISAESVERARSIVRDFHGNPRILRGPSPEPLQ
jgi:hypothetical protein